MKQNITHLALEDRPRERFMEHGASTLSKAELLAILIGSGNLEENAVQLMQHIMKDCQDSLATLSRLSVEELCRYKGIGPAKAITILAACELGNRRMGEDTRPIQVRSAQSIYDYFLPKVREISHEESYVLLLNQSLKVIGCKLLSRGGITGTVVDVRMILKHALLANATNLALCHNHPSGNTRPSTEDDALTEKVRKAAATMDIRLIDHVIVTDGSYYSYQEEGRL